MEPYKLELLERGEQPILTIRNPTGIKDLPIHLGFIYQKLVDYLSKAGGEIAGTPFTAYHGLDDNGHLDETAMDIEIGFPLSRELPDSGEIRCRVLPAGKALTCTYLGAYEEVIPVYEQMALWIRENGYAIAGTAFESYLTGPGTPEAEQQTFIVIPLRD